MIVTDRNSGLAIYGFDPVAYFTDRAPRQAAPIWNSSTTASPGAFATRAIARPLRSTPMSTCRDMAATIRSPSAEGMARPGHPEFWTIHDQRLYLFYSADAKTRLRADPQAAILQAESQLAAGERTLSP